MSFYVACQCGRAFEVEDGHSAPTARCPDCGRDVAVAAPESPSTSTAEPVETVDAELAGDEPAPIGPGSTGPTPEYGPPPGFGPEINLGGAPRQLDLQSSGTGCLMLLAAIAVAALAFPQFGAVIAITAGSCCVMPALIIGGSLWWRIRKFKQMTDPNRRPPSGGPGGPFA